MLLSWLLLGSKNAVIFVICLLGTCFSIYLFLIDWLSEIEWLPIFFISFCYCCFFCCFCFLCCCFFTTMLGLTINLNHKHCAILLVCRSKIGCKTVTRVGTSVKTTDRPKSRPQATLGWGSWHTKRSCEGDTEEVGGGRFQTWSRWN